MERRVRRLEADSGSVLLRHMARAAAGTSGLDQEEVRREAEAILPQCAGLSLPEIAMHEGIDLADLEAVLARGLREPA